MKIYMTKIYMMKDMKQKKIFRDIKKHQEKKLKSQVFLVWEIVEILNKEQQ